MADDEAIVGQAPEIAAADPIPEQSPETENDQVEAVDAPDVSDDDDLALLDDDDGDQEAGDEPEPVELNFGGNAVQFDPNATAKEVAEQAQKFADEAWSATTRRNQEIADQRKEVEARQAALDKVQQYDGQAFDLYTQALQADRLAQQYEQQLSQTDRFADADQYRFLSDDLARAKATSASAREQLAAVEGQGVAERTAEMRRRHEAGAEQVKRNVKGFDPDAVIAYAAETYGIDAEAAKGNWGLDPNMAIAMHKAMKWDQLQAKAAKRKPAPAQAKPVKAQARGGAGSRHQTVETMPIDQFMKLEQAKRAKAMGAR